MKRLTFIILAVFISFSAVSQKNELQNATVEMKDGTIKKGLIKPLKTSLDKIIVYKKDEDAKEEKIEAGLIKQFSVKDENGTHLYMRKKMYNYKKTKVFKNSILVEELIQGKASLYVSYTPDTRRFTSKGMVGGMPSDLTFYAMKKDDEAMSLIGVHYISAINGNSNSHFRKQAKRFFADSPKIIQRIDDEKTELLECVTLFEDYNK